MSIPKIFFTYWEGKSLSILHYYTVYSLHKYNPDVDIVIYTSTITSENFIQWNSHEHNIPIEKTIDFDKLRQINNNRISIVQIDFEKDYSINNNISIIFKADFIRIAKLYDHGGMWFDMDILFTKKIPDSLFNDVDLYYFTYEGLIPTGLLFSTPKNAFLNALFVTSLHILQKKSVDFKNNIDITDNYQVIGPYLWLEYFDNKGFHQYIRHKCLDHNYVYPYTWRNISTFLFTNNDYLTGYTFGIHWYNGDNDVKRFINSLDINNINPNNSVIEKYLYEIIYK